MFHLPPILAIQHFPNQTFIYTPTAAYVTHPYGISPRQVRDTVQLETAVSTISQEYLIKFTSEYEILEDLHPKLPGPEERIMDFPKGKAVIGAVKVSHFEINCRVLNINNQFFWVDERVFPTIADWRTSAPKDEMSARDTYSVEAVTILNTHRTPIQKQPEALLCLVDMDLFNLIRAPNPTKVKTSTRPRGAHEVPLLTVTASRVIEMEDPATATDSSRVPSPIERSSLDFANEIPSQQSTGGDGTEDQGQGTVALEVPPPENVATKGVAPEAGLAEEIAAMGPCVIKECRKRGNDRVDTNAPPKVLRRDHAESQLTQSTIEGKSLAAMRIGMGSTCPVPTSRDTLVDVSDADPLSFANPQSTPTENVAQSSKGAAVAGDLESEHTSFTSMGGSPERIYQPEWGVTNGCCLNAPKACQDLVDHIAPPGYFSELRNLHNDDFLKQYNINLARQVATGSQLRLRFEQEAKLLKKSVAQVARRDQRIQARENEIKNLEALLEAETDMKKTAKAKNTELGKELENLRALFSDLQVSNDRLSQQVSTLQAQVTGEEKLKAAFEEFKQYENDRVEKRCAEIDACLDALSIDFDEELYPHMLSAIAGRRCVIGHELCLAVMKCGESTEPRQVFVDVVSAGIAKGMSEGLKYEVEHGKANLDLEAIEAYDPKANAKYVAALHALKDLKYPMVDQLEGLKDAPIDVIMASLHLESDTGDDAPQWIRELRPSSSQLNIPVYPKVCDPQDPWAFKEEILLADAITANVSHAKKKKKCRVVCCTHGVGFAYHARSDGVPVSVLTVALQGLAILLADAATQTEASEDGSSHYQA
nr:hypothetical protein [Tanacetum cinerariifolium]